ncbi:MAG: serine/threonine protein kinase [bacterium]|nr:serine/threonine protein kinase [bacterium]
MKDVFRWSRYRVMKKIGEGGMGVVFKAYDPRQERYVALKFVKTNSPGNLRRFLSEARSQSQLQHKNICRVFEIGQYKETHFIAMQYIDGVKLLRAAPYLSIPQKVLVMQGVAEAVSAAHKSDIIHRDIKPANIMLQQDFTGAWHPYVMDFGLAGRIESNTLPKNGILLGTPGYISPELARGDIEHVDRHSDIFSIGSAMYEFFTGKRAFGGESNHAILSNVINSVPLLPHIHSAQIPREVEQIIMKCLEKKPLWRFDSTADLAAACTACLEGLPPPLTERPEPEPPNQPQTPIHPQTESN